MSNHFKTEKPSDLDLKRNPGIGQTARGIDQKETIFEDVDDDNTVEGDVMNDTAGDGSVKPNHLGRTNK
ncbi:hypothetical protein [Devosia submarina]|jgi:hypothetical protein|uniref:hypothetical protein n=1 Tax=Devosia submarina TaxID=1173082 RepID=UPI000D33723F|nr:hypothetical protein [Devosia submarina]